jgi:hypothetical protein
MVLLMQHIVEHGRARLAGFLPASGAALPRVKPKAIAADDLSRQWASAIYAGAHDLTAEEFAGLHWLSHFARCGRQLLMGHALGLIERWLRLKRRRGSMVEEARLVELLMQAAGSFACHLDVEVMEPATRALQQQIERLSRLKPRSASEALIKGTTLLDAGRLMQDSKPLMREGAQLLEQALPHLIAADGSPLCHTLREFVDWVSPLLAADDLPFSEPTRHALDRVGPFLSMLIGADHAYVFETETTPATCIHATAPLRLAPQARIGRLAAGKTVVVALPNTPSKTSRILVSSHNCKILDVGFFAQSAADDHMICDIALQHHTTGQLQQIRLPQSERRLFLAPEGDDLRVEDHLIGVSGPSYLRIIIDSETKLVVTHQGQQASIAVDNRNLWQLSLRGGQILPRQADGEIIIKSTGPTVNWALKRVARNTQRPSPTAQPDLFI